MEDYKKKYEEKLSKAKALHNLASETTHDDIRMVLEELFDELKESEDERIRKRLIEFLSTPFVKKGMSEGRLSTWIAWLEKLSEKTNPYNGVSFEYNGHVWGMCARDNGVDILLDKQLFKHLEKQGEQKCDCKYVGYLKQSEQNANKVPKFKVGDVISDNKSRVEIIGISEQKYIVSNGEIDNDANVANYFIPFENQSEWKLIEQKSDENVESKFKIGDWIVYCNEVVVLITGIKDNGYLINKSGYIPFTHQGNMRLWTILDAKDGDILVVDNSDPFIYKKSSEQNKIGAYCGIVGIGGFIVNRFSNTWINLKFNRPGENQNVSPATIKQRDLLFSKMKEKGYEWDAEKKELKKIEQKPAHELDNLVSNVEFPFKAKVKSSGKIVTIHDGQLSDDGKEWIKYQSNKDDGYRVYRPEDLEYICNLKGQIEQKPAWSEEDEKHLLGCINYFNGITEFSPYYNDFLWLKSLKNRVQPKQEWSEEGKARIDKIIDVLDWAEEKGYLRYSDWEDYVCYVKSLKPQNTWKPSNEQMEALWNAIPHIPNSKKDIDTIIELSVLYENLKKLREK